MNISKSNMLQNNIKLVNSKSNSSVPFNIKNDKKGKNNKTSKTIYAGNMNLAKQRDDIASKQVKEQRKAMKMIMDQYKSDKEFDDGITKLKSRQEELLADAKTARQEINRIGDLRNQLKEENGIEDGSEEETNLNLLRKSMNSGQTLSEDEMKQLKEMGPLTDYQKQALQYDAMEDVWQERYNNASNGVSSINGAITSAKLGKLKSAPMVEAQKEAAKIMEAASKSTIGALYAQAKDKIDENIEKKKEEADKKAEEEAKKAEKREKAKADNNNEEENTSQPADAKTVKELQNTAIKHDNIKAEIKNAINKLNLIDEDVKGIEVDKKI